MKALTISQPFASMIANGEKWIENRTWPTAYRGEIAIHAGKGTQYLAGSELAEYPTGCVIAVATLIHCIEVYDIRSSGPGDLRLIPNTKKLLTYGSVVKHKHAEGPWCWILENVRRIKPIPIRGAQGLWTFDKNFELEAAI